MYIFSSEVKVGACKPRRHYSRNELMERINESKSVFPCDSSKLGKTRAQTSFSLSASPITGEEQLRKLRRKLFSLARDESESDNHVNAKNVLSICLGTTRNHFLRK